MTAQVSQYICSKIYFVCRFTESLCQKMSWHIWCVLQVLGDAAELHGTHKHSKYHGLCQAPPKAPQMISLQNSTQPRSGEHWCYCNPRLLRLHPHFDIGGVESERIPYCKHGIPWYCWEAISSLLNLYSYCFFDIFSYQTSLNLLSKGTSSVRNSPHFPFTCKSHEVSTYVHNTTNLHEGNFWK